MKTLLFILMVGVSVIAHPLPFQQSDTIAEISLEMVQGSVEIGKPLGRAFKVILQRDGTA